VVCRQLVKGNKRGEEVFYVDVPKKAGEDWADIAALDIYGRLQTETATLGGLQKYALYSYHSGDFENHTGRFVIRLQGVEDEDEDDGLNSENPDKVGLTSQAMRHAEAYSKTMAGMVLGMVSGYQAMITRQSTMIEKLMEEKIGNLDAIQELMNDKEERDVRLMTARAKARGMENLVGKLGILLPAAVNKISGKPIFPVQDSSVMMMLRGLVTSLAADEEKLKALAQILNPEQSVAFMNILEAVSARTDENGLPTSLRDQEKKED
jgi:hypothetical protein